MGAIANKLQRVLDTKEDIRQALVEEGKDVPTDMPFRLYPEVIKNNKLPGLVGMYMGKDYTNDSMSKNPVWYDTSGNGNHIALKNFGWKLDSGCGKYAQDFTFAGIYLSKVLKKTNSLIEIETTSEVWNNTVISIGLVNWRNTPTKVYISRVDVIIYAYYNNDKRIELTQGANGSIVTIPALTEEQLIGLKFLQICINGNYKAGVRLSIEQIPDYDGAICFDGVDDYGICETFPVFTKEKGYTVMALRKWISRDNHFEMLVSNVNVWNDGLSAFGVEYKNGSDMTSSFGTVTSIKILNNSLVYQTSNEYNENKITTGNNISGSNILTVAKSGKSGFQFYSTLALYALAIFDHDTTVEERQPVVDYWKKEFPELFPDQAWTVTGKTNSDADRATIKNITGNGNDLVLTNVAFAENSGYGRYYQYFGKEFRLSNTGGELWHLVDDYTIKSNSRSMIDSVAKCYWLTTAFSDQIRLKFKVTGLQDNDILRFGNSSNYPYSYDKDGIYVIDYFAERIQYGFSLQSSLGANKPITDVQIEILPFDYEGYLVTDGVDDSIRSDSFRIDKDWTMVGEWQFINSGINKNAGIVKPHNIYIYNYTNNIWIYINSYSVKNTISKKISLKAVCSDGRAYDEDWNELLLEVGTVEISSQPFEIGSNQSRNEFAPTAFRNVSFYNNTLFTKEQCIRAYNYLQTIKNN